MSRRSRWSSVVAAACSLWLAPAALACSKDDNAYLDSFLNVSCLQTTTNTELDAFGGIRLTTNGAPTATLWDTDPQFDNGVTYQSTLFPPVGVSTLTRNGTGAAAALELPATGMPLVRDGANPVLSPTATDSGQLDNDSVDDPTVVKAGATYVMYYSGRAEDGSGPAIFRATSPDGKVWTKTGAVLNPSASSRDARGVFAPDVVYNASSSPHYTMYYSGKDDTFGAIFQATSDDGITWTKFPNNTTPTPVIDHGRAGSADSFGAQDPSVIKDGTTWKMWYTGDDSNRKRIAYATSQDGTTWEKGGRVISPEDGLPANLADGAFAPTVWKTGSTYNMVLTGLKITGGAGQTKLINASSSDGISWNIGSIALNQAGVNTKFDFSNLNSPFVLQDPTAPGNQQLKLYYAGNTIDSVTGGFHTRIGLATSGNGNSWSRFSGSGSGNSDLDIGTLGTAFDARDASGPAVVEPAGASQKFVGFYWGDRGQDFVPRLGEVTSADGSAWSKVNGTATGNAIFDLGTGAAFDAGGDRDPSALYEQNTGLNQPDYHLYFTALDSSRTPSIGYANAQETVVTLLPDNTTWSARTKILGGDGSGFDSNGASHPSVIDDAGTYRMYYTGTDGSGNKSIGCATATNAAFTTALTRDVCTVIAPTAGTFDKDGVKDPVVVKVAASDYRMTYTGVEKLSDPGGDVHTIERIGYATSTNGTTWTKQGVLIDPSQSGYAFDETGVEPAGVVIDGTTIHYYYDGIDRTGKSRGGHATGDTGTTSGQVESGWATYQVGDPSKTVRDWQHIVGTSTGTGVTIWVSFLQPYSSSGTQFWSDFFPVNAANASAALDFLLTVRGVRWQARESGPSGNPSLDKIEIDNAPVQFSPSGSAVTKAIGPPGTDTLLQWRTLTATSSTYAPNGGSASGTVKVLDAAGTTTLASQALNTSGDTTINLTGISATAHPTLKVEFDLTGGQASPLVQSLEVLYYTNVAPPPSAVVSLSASPAAIDPGATSTLSGTVTVGGTPFAAESVTILQKPNGAASFTPLTTTTTDSSGKFSLAVTPSTTTDYQASSGGGTSAPVTVTVNPPKTLTITATPAELVFGQTSTVSGNASQAGAPLGSQSVSLLQEPAGAAVFTAFGNPTTDAAGNWSSVVTPQSNTTYEASLGGATSPTAVVNVHQKITLNATRKLGSATFKGTIAPAHPNRTVVIQIKKGASFVTFLKTKSGATSAFSAKKKLKPCGKFKFRAVTAADADHLDGTSVIALVEKHRLAIKVAVKGRTITITGKVAPAHKTGTVLIKEIKGKRAVKLGKAKITKKSTFKFVMKLKKGTHKLRADMPSDRCHFAGSSKVKSVKLR